MSSEIVLYGTGQSRAGRIVWLLEELEVPFVKRTVDLQKGEQKKADFLALNPNGKVPVVTIDGKPMFESLAIFLHFADRYGVAKNLWPKLDDAKRLDAMSWTVWETAQLANDASRWFLTGSHFAPPELKNEAAAKAGIEIIAQDVALLEKKLQQGPWILGEHFSLADGWVGFAIAFFARVGALDVTRFPATKAWTEKLTARPAFQRTNQPW